MRKVATIVGSAIVLLALGAAPALAGGDDTHIVLYSEGDEASCYEKDVAIIIYGSSPDENTYVCFDYPEVEKS